MDRLRRLGRQLAPSATPAAADPSPPPASSVVLEDGNGAFPGNGGGSSSHLARRYHFTAAPRFGPEDWGTGLREHLREHGFAVASGVMDPGECGQCMDMLWGHVEDRGRKLGLAVDRADPSTWGERPRIVGPIHQHSEVMWWARGRPGVHALWAAIYSGERDLAVSFDGAQLWRPWDRHPEWQAQDVTGFLHCDRRPFPAPSSSVWCRCECSNGRFGLRLLALTVDRCCRQTPRTASRTAG